MAKIIATVLYWRFRYAFAPLRMAAAIFSMSGVPSENFLTLFACVQAKSSAITAPTMPSQK